MTLADQFTAIARPNEPMAPYTLLKIGGPAELFLEPRSRDELKAILQHCYADQKPVRVIGRGNNVLVRDEGVSGVVLRLEAEAFTNITVEGRRILAGGGASLAELIAAAALHHLSGFESLVGIPGTVGGAIRCNAGDRSEAIGQWVRRIEVFNERGELDARDRDELQFDEHKSNVDDPVIVAAEFELETDQPDAIVRRLRKAWITRKSAQPFSYQAAGRMFRDPSGHTAASLIEQVGLGAAKVGGVAVSERNANFLVAQSGATARDAMRLVEMLQSRVREQTGIQLEHELQVW